MSQKSHAVVVVLLSAFVETSFQLAPSFFITAIFVYINVQFFKRVRKILSCRQAHP